MNLVVLVILVLIPVQIIQGYRSGLVKGIQRCISWFVIALLFILIEMLYRFYKTSNTTDALICGILIVIVFLAWRVIKTVLLPARMLSKLPVIKGADKVLGVAFGIVELLIMIWLLDALLMNFSLGANGMMINNWMQENKYLRWLYENNYLITFEKWAEAKLIARF